MCSSDLLAPTFAMISHANPFHYAISGFRFGFIGTTDIPLGAGSALLVTINLALGLICYRALSTGWKLKN